MSSALSPVFLPQREVVDVCDTRQTIIDAAWVCFRKAGLKKSTIVEIGRVAGVSRGTVYQYFKDKEAIIEASAVSLSQLFYSQLMLAMEGEKTLEAKLTTAAVFVSQSRRHIEENEKYFDATEISVLLTKNVRFLLTECVDFLVPYLRAAKVTGEVRRDLDVQSAAEWFARILFSLFSTPTSTLEMGDPEVVQRFAGDHVIRGFGPDLSARKRSVASS